MIKKIIVSAGAVLFSGVLFGLAYIVLAYAAQKPFIDIENVLEENFEDYINDTKGETSNFSRHKIYPIELGYITEYKLNKHFLLNGTGYEDISNYKTLLNFELLDDNLSSRYKKIKVSNVEFYHKDIEQEVDFIVKYDTHSNTYEVISGYNNYSDFITDYDNSYYLMDTSFSRMIKYTIHQELKGV